jgi:hypothetical protein
MVPAGFLKTISRLLDLSNILPLVEKIRYGGHEKLISNGAFFLFREKPV